MQCNRIPALTALLTTFFLTAAGAQPRGAQPPQAQGQPPQQPQQAQQAQPAGPQPPQPFVFTPAPDLPMVELAPVLERVERASNKRFLVDRKVGPRIFLGGVEANDVTYPVLLSILRANGLAAVEIEGRVNIVLDYEVRFLPAPMVQADDPSIAADEWVTRVLTTTNVEAAFLVPILRPLLPQTAHLAAMPSSRLIVMDRYANVRRITEMVRLLDVPARD
jgi:type II secretory pathway component GspD/PulD (secretin)